MRLTRNEKRKRNYALIMNTYNNVELARRGREWSDATLEKQLAITVSKRQRNTIPALKEHTQKPSYFERKLRNTVYAIEVGHSAKEVRKVRSYKQSKIESIFDYNKIKKMRNKQKRIQAKIDKWEEWSKNDCLPPEIKKDAVSVNRKLLKEKIAADKEGFPILNYAPEDTDSYGYATKFYAYTREINLEDAEELVQYDFYDRYRLLYEGTVRVV